MARPQRGVGRRGAGPVAAASFGRGKVGSFARAAADKAADRASSARQNHQERERVRALARQGTPLVLPEALWVRDEPIEPPVPLLPA